MKLYVSPIAPNPTRLRLYLAEKREAGSGPRLEELMLNLPRREQHSPEHLARSPFGKVPVLELDDGRPFLAGASPSIADCTLAAALQFGRFGSVELEAG